MPRRFQPQRIPAVVGIGLVILALGGCGWFSRSKAKPPEAPAPQAERAPVQTPPPAPPPPAPPPAAAPPPASPKPADGRIATEEMLRGLVQGKTTKAEVRERFGVPREIIVSPAVETFLYYRDKTSGFFTRTTERIETLTLRFDLKGVLKDFEYRYAGK